MTVASASSGLFASVTASDSSRPSTSTNCGVKVNTGKLREVSSSWRSAG